MAWKKTEENTILVAKKLGFFFSLQYKHLSVSPDERRTSAGAFKTVHIH